MNVTYDFPGQVAVITGAARGVAAAAGAGVRAGAPITDDDVRDDWVTGRQRP